MQTIDIEVSRRKFRRELDTFLSVATIQRQRGIFLLNAEFPDIILSFAATKLQPAPIVFAVRINFENYDLEAPSVHFVNPFSWENLPLAPVPLYRKVQGNQVTQLVQRDEQGLPFICIPGVREYHHHPAHTGDHWLLYKGKNGVGTLGFIIDKLYEYGISAIHSYQLNLNLPGLPIFFDPNQIPL